MIIFFPVVTFLLTTIIVLMCSGGAKKKGGQAEPKAPMIPATQDTPQTKLGTQQNNVQTDRGAEDPSYNIFSVQPTDPVIHNRPPRKTADKAFDHSKPSPAAKAQTKDEAIIKLSKHIQEDINNPTAPSAECAQAEQQGSIPSPANFKAKCANQSENS